jgi:hypothetical protein
MRRVVLPNEEWRGLGGRRRREVARHARRGSRHPDPYVAAVAHAWAVQNAALCSDRPRTTVRSAVAWTSWAALIGAVGAVLGDAADVLLPGGSDWRERRLARRILNAGVS